LKEIEQFKEIGMCGTAAVVVKVQSIAYKDKVYEFNDFDTIASLRSDLTAVQFGEAEDKFGWMVDVCDVFDESLPMLPTLPVNSAAARMTTAEAKGQVQRVGSDTLMGHERNLLEFIVNNARPGDPDSVIAAMDAFWNNITGFSEKWNLRGRQLEEKVIAKVHESVETHPMKCLELGTYCGYSTLRIAKHLPDDATLLSVEKDELFAAIATKIIEFAGLESKVKIWMGTVHSELSNITSKLAGCPADFVLVDHSKERFVPDLRLLKKSGVVNDSTLVIGDVEVYPGDDTPHEVIQEDIKEYFGDQKFVLANML
jgi:predicted O-methyltransferase YrrM